MMKKFILLALAVFMVGCASRKEVVLFQDLDQQKIPQPDSFYHFPTIQVGDILKIDITALNQEAVIPFQFDKAAAGLQQARSLDIMKLEGYNVGKDGAIVFPVLGEIDVVGLTTRQAQKKIESLLSAYIKNASVKVSLLNFHVTVLGAVNRPGTYTITEERISLPQAIGLAGDFNIRGKRKDVLVVRTINGERKTTRIDFTKTDWMDGPYYYLKQNDLIYVEPNNPKVKTAGYIGNIGTLLSVASILMSAVVLIAR